MTEKDVHTSDTLISEWLIPPDEMSLNCHEVHVWRAFLHITASHVKHLKEILSADELIRADRFHFQRDRDHFIAARGMLRSLLGKYLKITPAEVTFSYGLFGKPELENTGVDKQLRFNISHSQGIAIFAFVQRRDLGVDLEHIRYDISSEDIAEKYFSKGEFDTLNALPEHKRQRAFFILWTRKEAYLKARGKGLSGGLNNFDVTTPALGEPAEPSEIQGFRKHGVSWLLRDLDVGPGYAAALAVEGQECDLKLWSCN
jgi:4'-phosphopantetheinyl transferase